MGGFYGSVQVRTEDRDAVVRAATGAAMLAGIRCLIGPALGGWVGVYPQGSGQDHRIGDAIAQTLGGEVLQAVVHDDDVMAYWFWYQGQLTDSYWSNPGYFNQADRAAQEQMSGDPQAFGPLVAKRAGAMLQILARKQRGFTIEALRLQQFAEFLGIHNAVTSYEYLKLGESVDIEARDQFIEVPTESATVEQLAIRQRHVETESKKAPLRKQGLLLADVAEEQLLPRVCVAGGGMLVAWEGYGRGESRIEIYRPPWGEAEPGEIETGGNVNSVSSDPAGRIMAMGLGHRVVVWDTASWQPILELVEGDWAIETAISPDARLVAYASRTGVYVHEIDSGLRLTSLSAPGGQVLTFHPDGEHLLCAGAAVWIARIRDTTPWRELYPGGQTAITPELSKAVRKEMSHVDVDALQEKWRISIEAAVAKLAASGANSAAMAPLIAKMREQMEKQLHEMRKKFASLKAGRIPPPRQGNEAVQCAGFTVDGKKLWLGTDQGLRVYDWPAVASAPGNSAVPRPLLSYTPPTSPLIYCAAELPGRNALLFGGYAGKVCQVDLTPGKVRELLAPPDGGAIVSLTIAPDGNAVGVCSRPGLGEAGGGQDERAVWQIWGYGVMEKLKG